MKGNKKGFTLLEMLIVVAIISVLVAVGVPVISDGLQKAKAATCAANRRSAKAEITIECVINEREPAELNALLAKYSCPEKGILRYKQNAETGEINVYCSIHEKGTSLGESIYEYFDKRYKEIKENTPGSLWQCQGTIREEIYNSQGGWDEIKFANSDKFFYVKPKYEGSTKDYFVYANTDPKNSTNSGWDADYIYNHEEGQWYRRPDEKFCGPGNNIPTSISTTKSWSAVKEDMNAKGWLPVAVAEEKPVSGK